MKNPQASTTLVVLYMHANCVTTNKACVSYTTANLGKTEA